jgi:hypothetical protein
MKVGLRDIPGLESPPGSIWKVRALAIDGNCPVIQEMKSWQKSEPADYKKILKVMRYAASVRRVRDPKKVKPCANETYDNTYEMRADKGHARIMFFYDEGKESIIICTTPFFGKGRHSGKQDSAFKNCHDLKTLYEAQRK